MNEKPTRYIVTADAKDGRPVSETIFSVRETKRAAFRFARFLSEVGQPNIAVWVQEPGHYRIDWRAK